MSDATDQELVNALADEGFTPADCTRELAARVLEMRQRIAYLQGMIVAQAERIRLYQERSAG